MRPAVLLLLAASATARIDGTGEAEALQFRLGPINSRHPEVLALLMKRRAQQPSYTILDVGGSMGGWSAPVATHLMDFNPPVNTGRYTVFKVGTINDAEEWKGVLDHVAANGKFDFCICTQGCHHVGHNRHGTGHGRGDLCDDGVARRLDLRVEHTVSEVAHIW